MGIQFPFCGCLRCTVFPCFLHGAQHLKLRENIAELEAHIAEEKEQSEQIRHAGMFQKQQTTQVGGDWLPAVRESFAGFSL